MLLLPTVDGNVEELIISIGLFGSFSSAIEKSFGLFAQKRLTVAWIHKGSIVLDWIMGSCNDLLWRRFHIFLEFEMLVAAISNEDIRLRHAI